MSAHSLTRPLCLYEVLILPSRPSFSRADHPPAPPSVRYPLRSQSQPPVPPGGASLFLAWGEGGQATQTPPALAPLEASARRAQPYYSRYPRAQRGPEGFRGACPPNKEKENHPTADIQTLPTRISTTVNHSPRPCKVHARAIQIRPSTGWARPIKHLGGPSPPRRTNCRANGDSPSQFAPNRGRSYFGTVRWGPGVVCGMESHD